MISIRMQILKCTELTNEKFIQKIRDYQKEIPILLNLISNSTTYKSNALSIA